MHALTNQGRSAALFILCAGADAGSDSAASPDPGGPPPPPSLLRRLLSRLAPSARCEARADAPEAAHEQALARLLGLCGSPASPAPWAALHAHALGLSGALTSAWAWLSLCHWQVGMDHVFMHDPGTLALDAAQAQALGAAIEPLLAGDGLRMHPLPATWPADSPAGVSPLWRSVLDAVRPRGALWLVEGELLRGRAFASVARAAGADIRPWLPRERGDAVARLYSELQMALYTQPVNDARAQARHPLANAVWLSAAGTLAQPPEAPALQIETRVAEAARSGDAAALAQAWAAVEVGPLATLAAALDRGEAVQLTLCGTRAWQSFGPGRVGLGRRLLNIFAPTPASNGLDLL